jgi:hypothetical protein
MYKGHPPRPHRIRTLTDAGTKKRRSYWELRPRVLTTRTKPFASCLRQRKLGAEASRKGSRRSAVGSPRSAVGDRQSRFGSRRSAVGRRVGRTTLGDRVAGRFGCWELGRLGCWEARLTWLGGRELGRKVGKAPGTNMPRVSTRSRARTSSNGNTGAHVAAPCPPFLPATYRSLARWNASSTSSRYRGALSLSQSEGEESLRDGPDCRLSPSLSSIFLSASH